MKSFRGRIAPRLVLSLLTGLVFHFASFAQRNATFDFNNANQLMTDVMGRPIYLKVEYNTEGSPYFPADYNRADVYTKSGKRYQGLGVRLNLFDRMLLMKMKDGSEIELISSTVSKVVFTDTFYTPTLGNIIFMNGFTPVEKQTAESFYQVLDSGKVKLLKYYSVNYTDKKEYGQASITRVYTQSAACYILLPDNTIHKIEKGKDAFTGLFPDKKAELLQFIEQNDYKCKKEEDWIAVVGYYNQLSAN